MRRKLFIATALILISVVTPFSRFGNTKWSLFFEFMTGDGLYLLCMMVAVSIAYVFILFEHYSRVQRRNARVAPDDKAIREAERHVYPMTLLICLSNIILGLSSYMGQDGHIFNNGAHGDPTCPARAFCTGSSIILVMPEVFVPNGMLLYAFWGAFIFSCFQYLQRIVNNDFPPSAWLSGAVRLAAAVLASILLFVVFFQATYDWKSYSIGKELVQMPGPKIPAGYAVALALFAGFFPMGTLRVVLRSITDRLSQLTPFLGKYVHTPLTVLDGITSEVQDRLDEAGIDSLQMLSRSTVQELRDPIGKALPYEEAVLADWIDQAKLALYFTDEAELADVRSIGIRTYSDLKCYQEDGRARDVDFSFVGLKAIPPDRLKMLITRGQFP